jgi:two-component system response regulator YesN
VLFENAIFVEFDDRISEITEYIENNLSQALSIGGICKEFSISKNTLYSLFRERFNKTVIEHITEMRMEKAKKLLRETKSTIYEIAEAVGFDNHTYFCRLFKKREGFSATEYRKVHQSK